MKKIILFLLLCFSLFGFFDFSETKSVNLYAENEEITEAVEEQLNNLDVSELEDILGELTEEQAAIFGNGSFLQKLKLLITGDFSADTGSIFTAISNIFFEEVLCILPLMAMIVAIAILFSIVGQVRGELKNNAIGDIIHFVCYGVIIVIVLSSVMKMISMTSGTITNIKNQMQAVFPILLTLLTAVGGTTSTGLYQPAFALASGTIIELFSNILLPIFIFSLVFSVISNMTNTVKLSKFSDFFSSAFKWILGLSFTLFFAFITILGISAGSYDGISFKAAKYAIKSSIPLVGSYLSDGLNLIVASSVLIKNGVGASGLLLLVSTIALPILKLVIFMFSLKLVSAILEPLVDNKISNFLHSIAKSISLLISIIFAVSFMYIILAGLVMATANFI